MPEPALYDEAARSEIRSALRRTLFVEAGAGTGKTTVLVERIVNLVRSGVEMRHVAAITFTEAAATELRDRIRAALLAAATEDPALAAAADQVDEAAIATLHAFAQRILAEHPVEAGLPPAIEVLDEIQSALAFEERWSSFLDRILSDDAYADLVLPATAIGLRLDALRELALVLDDHWDRLEDLVLPGTRMPAISVDAVIGPLRTALAASSDCHADDDLLLAHLRGIAPVVERLERAPSDLEVLHLLAGKQNLSCGRGRKNNWLCDVTAVRAACADAEAARQTLIESVGEHALTALLGVLQGFTLDAARARRAGGRLEFHDLLVLARAVVRDRSSVRRALRARFSHVLIDEFQDTDPLQVELALLLATSDDGDPDDGDPDATAEPSDGGRLAGWEHCTLEPGRLFFVGDAMQSIYRFRRADISLFTAVRRLVGDVEHLTANHRSVPGILSWVNEVFAQLIGDGGGAQPAYQPLVAAREADPGNPVPVILLGDGHDRPIAAVRDDEAAEIAQTVLRVHDERWLVAAPPAGGSTDGGLTGGEPSAGGHWRPAQLRDVAILMPTRASLPQLEDALERVEIPYRVESASLVWGTQAVRDLLAVLRAVDDPADAVSTVASLRSPAFACGDDDLLQFVQAGGRWDYRADPPPALSPEHPVVAGLRELRELHGQRWWASVSGLVDLAMRRLQLLELAFAHRRPRDHWRRLRWVLDQARAFEEADGGTLRDFVTWADRQADENARVKESALPDADDDAVRILTIHGAKGLQFPIVMVTGLNRPPTTMPNRPATVLWDGPRPEVKTWGGFRTAGFEALQPLEGELDEQEKLRLLYVALTRAEDHLVVSIHHKHRDRSQAMVLADVARSAEAAGLWRRLGPPPLALVQQEMSYPPGAPPSAAAERRAWSAARAARVAANADAPVVAATAIAELGATGGTGFGLGTEDPDVEAPPWRRGRAGTAIGRAVHAVLQSIDLASGDGLAATARAQAAAEGVDDAAAEIERLAGAALSSSAVKQAVASRHWRELYVAAPLAGTTMVVEGFVDLVYEDGDGLVVVDYKTDSVRSDADIEAGIGRYRLQAATYTLALETTLERPVVACVFVFVSGGHARERQIGDLQAAKEEVRRLLSGR